MQKKMEIESLKNYLHLLRKVHEIVYINQNFRAHIHKHILSFVQCAICVKVKWPLKIIGKTKFPLSAILDILGEPAEILIFFFLLKNALNAN